MTGEYNLQNYVFVKVFRNMAINYPNQSDLKSVQDTTWSHASQRLGAIWWWCCLFGHYLLPWNPWKWRGCRKGNATRGLRCGFVTLLKDVHTIVLLPIRCLHHRNSFVIIADVRKKSHARRDPYTQLQIRKELLLLCWPLMVLHHPCLLFAEAEIHPANQLFNWVWLKWLAKSLIFLNEKRLLGLHHTT